MKKSKFNWGEAVSVVKSAPPIYRPGEFASICGIDKITTQKEADEFLCKNGEWIYIIEYEDGSSIEIPESHLQNSTELPMSTEIKIFPLQFERAFRYVTDQLQDGHALARELLASLDFREGCFFALLCSSADRTKIHDFRIGGILAANPLEAVPFQGKVYPGRKKANSVNQLALYLKSLLQPGQCCFFEDMIHHRSDPIEPEIKRHILYFHEEVYLFIKENEFSQEIAEKIIHYSDAQWHYMNIISEAAPGVNPNMTSEQLQNIALKANLLVIGAYDMEGFVVWKR